MNYKTLLFLVLSAVLLPTAVLAEAESAVPSGSPYLTSLLEQVPADTPFVYAFNAALPGRLVEYLFQQRKRKLQEMFNGYLAFSRKRHDARNSRGLADSEADRIITTLIHRIQADFTREGFHKRFGIDLDDEAVLYGYGVIPVFRMVLDSPDRFTEAITGILEEAGSGYSFVAMPEGERLELPFTDELRLVLAVQGKTLVVTLAPHTAGLVDSILGNPHSAAFEPFPKEKIIQLISEKKYSGQAIGVLDTRRFMKLVFEPAGEEERTARDALLQLFDVPMGCEPLLQDLSDMVPQLHAGILTSSEAHMETQFGIEVAGKAKTTLEALISGASPSPSRQAMASLGVSMHLPVFISAMSDLLVHLSSNRYDGCGWVDSQAIGDYQATLALLNNPLVHNVTGLLIDFNDFSVDPETRQPALFSMEALLQFESAEPVVASLVGMSPKIASLGLTTDGHPISMETRVENRTVTLSMAADHRNMAIAMGNGDTKGKARSLLNEHAVTPGVLAGYSIRGERIADKLASPDNPDNAKTFLSWLREHRLYRGVVKYADGTLSLTTFQQLSLMEGGAER